MKLPIHIGPRAWLLALVSAGILCCPSAAAERVEPGFNTGWRFLLGEESEAWCPEFADAAWDEVTLPHTARLEALVTGGDRTQWQGVCWYRKTFALPLRAEGKCVWLRFEGAMNTADVWVNGVRAGRFMGGYLPYVMDVSEWVKAGEENVVAVRLDNRDNPLTGPKPLKDLDFNLYGGLYRPARLIVKETLHITDSILADKVAGGGVFVTTPEVTPARATVRVQTHVRNASQRMREARLRTRLLDSNGETVATRVSDPTTLDAETDQEWVQEIRVVNPTLWSPGNPALYTVRSELIEDDAVLDSETTRIGIRHILITRDGLRINGKPQFLRGANRHQEYPYVGNALSDAAQYRDALKIKEAGFDYVRLSHYPQSPAFLDACDELGLLVMNCLMGWQFFNPDPAFAELKYEECRQLVRRDRNHPCVLLWEVCLNESRMPAEFIHRTQAIAHEEYPGDQCYTCGWTEGYDVFIQARQHGGCRGVTNLPCVVSEYGDWEYYAQNAGLQQHLWKDLEPAERSSRQLRGAGQVRLLQQALNFQEAHNDNLQTTAFADGVWVMFDYNRGYAEDIEASGVMDIFRLPKFGYWFFRSQREPEERIAGKPVGPMVFIANHWTADSPLQVRVFSNCDEVALQLNGRPVERRPPDANRVSTRLKHPPFTFALEAFEPGRLEAVGLIDGRAVARHERRTPGEPARLALRFDLAHRPFADQSKDAVFCYADVLDQAGNVVPDVAVPVAFGATGEVRLVGHNPILSEAGTATALIESDGARRACRLYALGLVPTDDGVRILSASASPHGTESPQPEIRYTTDGSTPTMASPLFRGDRVAAPVCAALFVNGERVAKTGPDDAAASTSGFPASSVSGIAPERPRASGKTQADNRL